MNTIATKWAEKVDPNRPLPEYPRPQLRREHWEILNGYWDYSITDQHVEDPFTHTIDFKGKIVVPFCIESKLSQVEYILQPDEYLWYHREISVDPEWKSRRILLHFGAVDYISKVWLNGELVGTHEGGYTPFSFEISEYLQPGGPNHLWLRVEDPSNTGYQSRGKQVLDPHGIWYTPCSGIWQTVWMEPVEDDWITGLNMIPDIDHGVLKLSVETNGPRNKADWSVEIAVPDEFSALVPGEQVLGCPFAIKIPSMHLWSPEDPFLYAITITLRSHGSVIDSVTSYFGMRQIEHGTDANSVSYLKLNHKRVFHFGPLDQGYWPTGNLTAPTDEALKYDIEMTKKMGFNMIRKHVKVEPARWYYHCDKMGVLVWQDMVNGGKPHPPLRGYLKYRVFKRKILTRSPESQKEYFHTLTRMIESLRNHPSIVVWVPFNEGWGQFDTKKVVEHVRSLDDSRLINAASGWFYTGDGDFKDRHVYMIKPIAPIKIGDKIPVIGEFGGLALPIPGHTWGHNREWGYVKYKSQAKFREKYHAYLMKLLKLKQKGKIAGAVYTQTTDVEGEINGLLTYDREIVKLGLDWVREINSQIA